MAKDYQFKHYRQVQAAAALYTASGSGTFFGRRAVTANTVVISTTAVNTDSVISVTLESATTSLASAPPAFFVSSINPGNAFSLQTVASLSPVGSFTAMWTIANQS